MNRRCGSSKPTPTPLNGLALKPGKTGRKVIEGNANTIIRQTNRQKPAAYRQCGGGARSKRRYVHCVRFRSDCACLSREFVASSNAFKSITSSFPPRRRHWVPQRDASFLGHSISPTGLRPNAEKMSALINMPMPTDVKQVRALMGGVNYYTITAFFSSCRRRHL